MIHIIKNMILNKYLVRFQAEISILANLLRAKKFINIAKSGER